MGNQNASAPTTANPNLPTTPSINYDRASTISKPAAPATTASDSAGAAPNKRRAGQFPIVNPIFNDICELQGVTLTRYMMEVSRANPHLTEVESLMNSIQTACKVGRCAGKRKWVGVLDDRSIGRWDGWVGRGF